MKLKLIISFWFQKIRNGVVALRTKKALYNTGIGITFTLISAICSLFVPRLILLYFGSAYNGLTASISQFLAVITLLSGGASSVTKAALYKPLAENSLEEIAGILRATELFVRKVALIFLGVILIFAIGYSQLVSTQFPWFFSFTLICILGLGIFGNYYFGVTFKMLLQADQKQYIISIILIITTLLNTIVASLLIISGFSIHMVKLASTLVFLLNPLFVNIYIRRKYKISLNVAPNYIALKQRWAAFAHQVAGFVYKNTDLLLLTYFVDLKEVSVFTVYTMVIRNIRNIILKFSAGFSASFGDMFAKNELKIAEQNLSIFELIIFSVTTVLLTTTSLLILSFITIYTQGIYDVNYDRPLFAFLMVLSAFFNCIRVPYQTLVEAKGHFKQTRNGAIFESFLNFILSLILIPYLGIIGAVIGSLCATIFRTFQFLIYLSKNIIRKSLLLFLKRIMSAVGIAISTALISLFLFRASPTNLFSWVFQGFVIVLLSSAIAVAVNYVLYRDDVKRFWKKITLAFGKS